MSKDYTGTYLCKKSETFIRASLLATGGYDLDLGQCYNIVHQQYFHNKFLNNSSVFDIPANHNWVLYTLDKNKCEPYWAHWISISSDEIEFSGLLNNLEKLSEDELLIKDIIE